MCSSKGKEARTQEAGAQWSWVERGDQIQEVGVGGRLRRPGWTCCTEGLGFALCGMGSQRKVLRRMVSGFALEEGRLAALKRVGDSRASMEAKRPVRGQQVVAESGWWAGSVQGLF